MEWYRRRIVVFGHKKIRLFQLFLEVEMSKKPFPPLCINSPILVQYRVLLPQLIKPRLVVPVWNLRMLHHLRFHLVATLLHLPLLGDFHGSGGGSLGSLTAAAAGSPWFFNGGGGFGS
ncbi:hypothetical protein NQ318_004779 [Aromia moschata]|uniref:Uncharacterized protein n=1 Tax=Aromia moschata TaxID=1265417 RepID=A0AAV8XSH9_9CUCU|nr:hypothetical protein NQ318_004779 [Aromia moschata]